VLVFVMRVGSLGKVCLLLMTRCTRLESFFLTSVTEAVGAPATNWDGPGIIILKLLAVVFLVLLNGFFVASEFAIVKVRASQLDALATRGIRRARLARHVTSHLDAYLSATQVNGLANWLLKRVFHLEPVAENELAHSEEELRLILDESAKAARISPVSQEIATNAFEIRRRLVREVMTPRGEVVYLDVSLSFRDNLRRAKGARHTRFPLCVGHFDRTIGLVHIKDILAHRQSGSDRLEKQPTDPASAGRNPRDLGDGTLWITTQRQSRFGLRKVGHSFEGLIDSHLGVIADSADNGVDLRLWPNAQMMNLIVNAVEAMQAVSNRALALLIRTEEQSSDNLDDKGVKA
jgi:Cyclin M transmembrane N-terminal domain